MNLKKNMIAAYVHISESDIAKIYPEYTYEMFEKNKEKLEELLWTLGLDIKQPYEMQGIVNHRNMSNEIVCCGRYFGESRTDNDWIKSGYASREAIDKASGSKLLEELYRAKGLTIDAQLAMEYKDKYSEKGEE